MITAQELEQTGWFTRSVICYSDDEKDWFPYYEQGDYRLYQTPKEEVEIAHKERVGNRDYKVLYTGKIENKEELIKILESL